MVIKLKTCIETAFSIDDAQTVYGVIQDGLKTGEKVILDFTDVEIFTTLFFNNAITRFLMELSPEVYQKRIELTGLSEVGATTYRHSYDNALNYYALSRTERETQASLIEEPEDC